MKHKLKKLYKESWSVQGTVPLFSLRDWGKSCKTSARLANWFLGCVRHMTVHTWSSSAIKLPHLGLRFVSDSVLKKCFIKSSPLFYMYCTGVSFFWKESISNTWDRAQQVIEIWRLGNLCSSHYLWPIYVSTNLSTYSPIQEIKCKSLLYKMHEVILTKIFTLSSIIHSTCRIHLIHTL